MSNEPVARVNNEGFIVEIDEMLLKEGTLLYTHPPKDLTDEEILKKLRAEISSLKRKVNHEYIRAELALANRKLTDKEITEIYFDDPDILVFAKAILRKAQEK